MSGLRFACDPDGPNTCASGFVCVRAEPGHSYKGVCVRVEDADVRMDSSPADPGVADDGMAGEADASGQDLGVADPGPADPGVADGWLDHGPWDPGAADDGMAGEADVCMPECQGKQCGPDGCGGSCGECPAGTSCVSGTCRPTCWTGPCPGGYQKYDGCRCRVAPTGVTQCMVLGQANFVACSTITPGQSGYGQDGHFPSGSLSYMDKGDGSVLDNLTGLVWSEAPDDDAVNWNTAKTTCSSKGWHLPTVVELLSLVDYSKGSCPMWDAMFGTACPAVAWFWTSVPWSSSSAFSVYFGYGGVYNNGVGGNYGVRCVRAGQE